MTHLAKQTIALHAQITINQGDDEEPIVACKACSDQDRAGFYVPWPCLPYRLAAELVEAREREQRVRAVHGRYFDLDGVPGEDDTTPEPEDVWRFDRDFRAALDGDHA